MKKQDVAKVMTTIVTDAFDEGFALSIGELRGSYGGIDGYVVLWNGDERIIVWTETNDMHGRDVRTYRVMAARIHLETHTNDKGGKWKECLEHQYRWPSDWERHTYYECTFYGVGDQSNDWYTEDRAEAEEARERAQRRHEAAWIDHAKDLRVTPQMMRFVHRIKGMKTIRARDVRVTRRDMDGGWRRYTVHNLRNGKVHNFDLVY